MTDTNGHSFHDEETFLTDALDHEILMHRDAHFGGSFETMLTYYEDEGIGCHPDFDMTRIAYLNDVEKKLGKNLAPLILNGQEAEKVALSRKAYQNFKSIYELNDEKSREARLIADLILSEEEEPAVEINAIVDQGCQITPELLRIVESDDAYDPLFPGYGYAPYLAIICLGKIKDESAIRPLFEALGRENVFGDEVIVEALNEIGDSAKKFLLKVLASRPLTQDNIQAAFALSTFPPDSDITAAATAQLQKPEVANQLLLSSYLNIIKDGEQNNK